MSSNKVLEIFSQVANKYNVDAEELLAYTIISLNEELKQEALKSKELEELVQRLAK